MKHLLTSIAIALIGCLLSYLMGGFIIYDWNLADWSIAGRFTLMLFFSGFMSVAVLYYIIEKPI